VNEDEQPSRAAGGCVVTVAGALVVGGVFYASQAVAVLLVWTLGGLALWLAIRRPNQDRQPLPSPTGLGPEDYVSPDGRRVYRKRSTGYSVEYLRTGKDDE
jgi:hypothetical protein